MNLYELLNTSILLIVLLLCLYITKTLYKPRLKSSVERSIMLDSSALIDGRVLAVAQAGFLSGTLVVPSSVLREMQYLADNSDHDKRLRARHGLDVVHELQNLKTNEVQILQDGKLSDGGVDERLIKLCKIHVSELLTLDFNLNKVAQAEGVTVLNINELAQALRLAHLPGEKHKVLLVQKGQDKDQAVGYLSDGTMVVVEHAAGQLNQEVEVEFTRALQTQAGKMLFAKKAQQDKSSPKKKQPEYSRQQVNRKTTSAKPSYKKRQSPEDKLVNLVNDQNR